STYFDANASLLYSLILNRVKIGKAGKDENHLSPSIGFSIKPFYKSPFRIRFFYKNIFRMPTFNDLYYRDIGNVKLNPERTNQLDAGITFDHHWLQRKISFLGTADFYYNFVKDKIVAIPSKNLFVWSMLNYGEVEILGVDVTCNFSYQIIKQCGLLISGSYSFQRAWDMTDEQSKTYRHQIPYTPKHSGSASVSVVTDWFTVSYSILLSGKRYTLGQNTLQNQLKGYTDQSISIGRDFKFKKVILGLRLEMLNLADTQYEVVRNFPMQGRSFRINGRFLF
ncbi:MAG: TonB-dependent receptor, partial [Bacteroidales bacterium]